MAILSVAGLKHHKCIAEVTYPARIVEFIRLQEDTKLMNEQDNNEFNKLDLF